MNPSNATDYAIPPAQIEAVGRPDLEAETFPGECYWREDIHQRELDAIFYKEWICVGRVEDIPNPGDYLTETIGAEPVIVVRDGSGEVRAHLNVCRHRGCRLVAGTGSVKTFRCPYHGWMYGLTGELRGTPDFSDAKNFDKADYSLHPVSIDLWNGFIMVNLDPDATPYSAYVSETDRCGLDKYGLESMVTTHRWSYQLECNWKTYVENYTEEYHVPWVHAETFQPVTPMKGWVEFPDLSEQPWSVMVGQYPGFSLSDTGEPMFPISPGIADLPPEYDGMPIWLGYPTLMVIPVIDCMIYYVAYPRGPEQCEVKLYLCLPEQVAEKLSAGDPKTVEAAAEYARNTVAFIKEDNEICVMQQLGLRSARATPGRFTGHEGLARQFDSWVAEKAYMPRSNGSADASR